ncbi:MAG TPA: hypothetical protein VH309_14345 [Elusimicrobiota bacterium]|jgi:hypothetical protein|nr:hypothetical protein [Elusimicrobiota bacterium]
MRPPRTLAFMAALTAAFAPWVPALAGPAMTSGVNAVSRTVANGGGKYSASGSGAANNQLTGSAAEEVMITTSASGAGTGNNRLRSGFSEIAYYPGALAALTAGADVTASSVTLGWATPGYDGSLGTALAGSAYLVQIASAATRGNLANLNAIAVTISTSAQALGKDVGSGVSGLDPNTTYYAQAFLRDGDGDVSGPFATAFTTFTTLSAAPRAGALEFLSVQPGSVTVAWIAPYQLTVGSQTNEGYTLLASSNDFGALGPPGAPIFSSTTYNVKASTLTLDLSLNGVPLDLSNTYYFQVGSLNWVGVSSFTAFNRLNFEIAPTTSYIHLGSMDPNVARSTVSTSSMVVVNVGNWPATIELVASTVTAGGSPWTLGYSPDIEIAMLQGLWNSTAPPPSAFSTYLTSTTLISQSPGNFAGGQTGFQIPSGGSSSLWIYLTLPASSASPGSESVQVRAQAVYP